MIGAKAEVKIKTKKNTEEMYRFYYPYQQVMKNELKDGSSVTPTDPDDENSYTTYYLLLIFALVAIVGVCCVRRMRAKKRTDYRNAGLEMKYSDFT